MKSFLLVTSLLLITAFMAAPLSGITYEQCKEKMMKDSSLEWNGKDCVTKKTYK